MVLTISRKLLFLNVLAALIISGLLAYKLLQTRSAIHQEENRLVLTQVESAMSIVTTFAQRVDAGELDLAEAQAQAKAALSAIRFKSNDYVFSLDTAGILLIHPNASLVGTNVLGISDPNGVDLFVDLIDAAEAGGGFVPYEWPRAGSDEPLPKISYAALFEPWNWIVATGVYTDDVTARIQVNMLENALIVLAALALLTGGVTVVARTIKKPIRELTTTVHNIREGDIDSTVALAERPDEIGQIATEVEALRQTLLEKRAGDEEKARMREEVEAARVQKEEESRRAKAEKEEREKQRQEQEARIAADKEEQQRLAEVERKRSEQEQDAVVEALAQALKSLSHGRFDVAIEQSFPDAYEQLRLDFNETVRTLSRLISDISMSSITMQEGTAEIANSAMELSTRTEVSAATLERTAAALNELANSVSSAAEATSRTNSLSKASNEKAQKSLEIAEDTAAAMVKIKSSSDEIMTIVDLINGIAFQTNLLALNAGVEAARAGESGRGFAVVASEVRALAQRSAEASEQINRLVTTSTEQVNHGTELVNRSGTELRSIVDSMEQIKDLVGEVASSTDEQARSIADVNQAIAKLEADTQRNAAMSEEASAASTKLDSEAVGLTDLVKTFAVSDTAQGHGHSHGRAA